MPRPGFISPEERWRECPRCRYPMLRATKLPGISDSVGFSAPPLGLAVPMLYELIMVALVNAAVGVSLFGLLNLYRLVGSLNGWVAAVLMALEVRLLWRGRRRVGAGWTKLLADWFAAGVSRRDDWQGNSLLTLRRRFGRGGGRNGLGLFLGMLLSLPFVQWFIGWLPSDLKLSGLAGLSLLLTGAVCILLLPELLASGIRRLESARSRKRHSLLARLSPDDWVCPNCLYAESRQVQATR